MQECIVLLGSTYSVNYNTRILLILSENRIYSTVTQTTDSLLKLTDSILGLGPQISVNTNSSVWIDNFQLTCQSYQSVCFFVCDNSLRQFWEVNL